MFRFPAVLGLSLGLLLIGAALAALPFTVAAREEIKMAETAALACPTVEIDLDRGYGVSRVETRHICASRDR